MSEEIVSERNRQILEKRNKFFFVCGMRRRQTVIRVSPLEYELNDIRIVININCRGA